MARSGFPWSSISTLLLLSFVSNIISKNASGPNSSSAQVSPSKDKCHNVYTSNNFYAGPNKKIEALLHEIQKELSEMREEIRCLKENKTIGKGRLL